MLFTFAVGDMVLLNADHISLAANFNQPSRELEPKYIGSYQIVSMLHGNAYELALPSTMQHHRVFNLDL